MIDWIALASWLAAVFIGAAVNVVCSRYYYMKAGEDLVKEAAELRKLTGLILRAMEDAGLAKLSRDDSGNPVGLVIQLSGTASMKLSASGELTATKVGE